MRKEFFNKKLCLIVTLFAAQTTLAQIPLSPDDLLGKISTINKNWQQGGIFNGEYPEKEILASRTEYTKKFDKGNGVVDMIFGGPFHYADNKGGWQDINLNIKHQANGVYAYLNEENKFISRFAKNVNDGVKMEYKNTGIGFGINTSIAATNWIPTASNNSNILTNENSIAYKNIYENIDLEYKLTTEAMQHRMIFKNKNVFKGLLQQHFITVEETINLPFNTILKDENGIINTNRITKGNIFIVVNEDTIFTILSAHIWDASFKGNILEKGDEIISGVSDIKTSVYFLQDNAIKLIATIPTEWLLAPERVYPITLDPTVNVGNAGSFNSSYRYPFNTCRQQRISQILFLKSDINAGNINTTGNITQINFFQNTNNPIVNNNVRVKMQEVMWNEMTTPTLTSSGFTDCNVPGTQNFTSGGSNNWRSLTLGNQFPFTNTKNLLIEVSFNNSPNNTSGCTCTNTGPGGYWGWYNSPYAGHRWAYSNSAAIPPSGADCNYNNSPEGNPAYGYFIPATRITINTAAGCSPVNISSHPSSQNIVVPAQAQFSVSVSGTTPIYQWKMSTDGGATWGNVPAIAPYSGSTSNQLTINPTSAGMNGNRFRCEVTNSCTTPSPATSNTAVLTINAAGCATVITPTSSPSIPASGGTGSFGINVTPNTCSWSASETLTWVTITSPLSGTGDATLSYTVAANTGTARSGIITVNGQNYTVNQLGAAAPTTYIISGRVIENGSPGLPGVTISTSPAAGTAITDAQGYYTITVPLSYTGTVTPTLAPFNFTPLSRTVSSTNYNNKDFDAAGVSIAIISSIIPPWQREGDDYNGSITVQIGNTTTNSWHLEADVYNGTTWVGNVTFPSTTSNTYQFNTFFALPVQNQQLKNLSLNGRTVKYAAVFDANTTIQAYLGTSTDIIEKKWNNKNYVFYNSGSNQILIPLRYFPNCISATINFSRVPNVSNASNKITNVPIVQFGNQRYFILNNVNSLIRGVSPGVFNYTINYNPSGFYQETGSFDLTKIANVHNTNLSTNNIVVLVGGILNNIEKDIFDLPSNNSSQSNQPWSVANDLSIKYGLNTWYIAQGNMNSTQKNAYNLGIALEEIRKICINAGATSPNISVIAHSKGGLEMRLMMDKMGAPANSPVNFTTSPNSPFINNTINGVLKSVIFIGTPHQGSLVAYAVQSTPGGQDLLPNSQMISYLKLGTRVPNIRIANISGYNIKAIGNALLDVKGDGVVTLESSSATVPITGQSLFRQFYLAEDYSPFGLMNYLTYLHGSSVFSILNNLNTFLDILLKYSFHAKLHRSFNLNNFQNSCPTYSTVPLGTNAICQLTVNAGTSSMLSKILAIINNTNIPENCTSPANISCSGNGQTWASVLTNAAIYKQNGLLPLTLIDRSDENGNFNFQLSDSLKLGDTLMFSSNGVDTLIMPLDSSLVYGVDKFPISFFNSSMPTLGIKYPKISLVNQELVTNNPLLPIKVSSKNSNSVDIISNSDTAFRRISLSDTTGGLLLENGFNLVVVRFNGAIDSVILGKIIYYIPDSLINTSTYNCTIVGNNNVIGTRVYLNNHYYKRVNSINSSIKVLQGNNFLDFYKFGFKKFHSEINSGMTVDLNLMQPISYSSLNDSSIFNFAKRLNPQYWKTITVKSLSATTNKQVSAMQYDDAFSGMSLKPQTRKFVFRKLGSAAPASFKTAIALDQVNTPDKDSVYLLYKNGKSWVKYLANQTGISEYDPEVQKIAFDKLYIDDDQTREIVLMQKQAPIMKTLDTIWHSGQTIAFPLSIFVGDPDSIKNDLGIFSNDAKVSVVGNIVYITAPVNFIGTTSYSLSGTHDFLDVSKTYTMKVIPPEVYIPNAFTPNQDGLNDVIRPIFLGKLISCHFTIFNRNGQKVYETTDCMGGWDGRIKGAVQDPGTYVWMLSYQFAGEEKKETKGTVVLVK